MAERGLFAFKISCNYMNYQSILSSVKKAIRNSIEFHDINLSEKPLINFDCILYVDLLEPIKISKAKSRGLNNSFKSRDPCVLSFLLR